MTKNGKKKWEDPEFGPSGKYLYTNSVEKYNLSTYSRKKLTRQDARVCITLKRYLTIVRTRRRCVGCAQKSLSRRLWHMETQTTSYQVFSPPQFSLEISLKYFFYLV
jgi:hypothetical protein